MQNKRTQWLISAVLSMVLLLPMGMAQAQGGVPAPTSKSPTYWLVQAARAYQAPLAPTSPAFEVIAAGLNNPRGLTFGNDGALYVAEAGLGGDGPCIIGGEGNTCYGPTGSITRIKDGVQTQFVTGLPSLAGEESDGFGAIGPVDVSPRYQGLDAIIGLGADPALRDQLGSAGATFGRTLRVLYNGTHGYAGDISTHEALNNPDGGLEDSNPYSIFLVDNGRRVVADAGGNDLVAMFLNLQTATLAVFPDRMELAPPFLGLPPGTMIPMQAVPTSVVVGPDGALYVGQLTGFPFPVGGANVYRVVPGSDPEVFAGGFTNIIDIAFDTDGNLYVLEISHNGLLSGDMTGALTKVTPSGDREILAMDGLVAPGGVTIGPDGALYITNFSIFPGAGQVIRLDSAVPVSAPPTLPGTPDALDQPLMLPVVNK